MGLVPTAAGLEQKVQPQLLEIRNLTFGYNKDPVLKDVSLSLAPGEIVAVTGPSGSGKSTLLALAGLLRTPPLESVFHWGQDMARVPARHISARRRSVRIVFQKPYLLRSLTVFENIKAGVLRSPETDSELADRISLVLRLFGLGELRDRWPEEISGGQQQRVAIARAMIGKPELLLADEPTASLDFEAAMIGIRQMKSLAASGGCGIIITTHDPRIVSHVDRHLILIDGKLTPR